MSISRCEMTAALKKGKWIPEEDTKLIAYINRYGIWNWCQIPKHAGLSRSGKSCRLRWLNYLRPDVKRGNYTREEDETIMKLHGLMGTRWSEIAARLPGRTDNEIKKRWHSHLKKRSKDNMTRLSTRSHDLRISNCDYSDQKSLVEVNSIHSAALEATNKDKCEVPNTLKCEEIQKREGKNVGSFETFGDLYTSFWREPFLLDNVYMADYHNSAVVNLGFELPIPQEYWYNEPTNSCCFTNFNLLTCGQMN